jgi:tetratricopeptide (TPR) repeat protein
MRALEQILRWTAIGGAFSLPFVVFYIADGMFFPFITGKNFYFRIVVEIMAAAWLALALILPQYRPRKNWILAAFAVFVLIMAIADAQGVNPFKSFWSNFERMDGWVTIAHLFTYLVVVVSVLNTEKLWRRLFQLSLAVSVGVGFMGMRQLFGWSAVGQGGANGLAGRIDATFGNAIYLAAYDLFHIFLAAMLWVQEWRERKPGKRMWMSITYGSVIVFDIIVLLFTGTRGTTLGLIGGATLAGLVYVFRAENAKRIRIYVFAAIGVLIVIAGILYTLRSSPEVAKIGFLVRLANISINDPTVQSRYMNWGMAWQGFKERPILGWGQENYAIVFDKYYDPGMHSAEPWFDRVHNSIFDWLVAGGMLGLAAYLSIFATALYSLWRSRAFRHDESAILIGLFAGYFFHNLFVFDNVTSYILFATVLGYVIWRESEADKTPRVVEAAPLPKEALGFSMVGCAILVASIGWWANAPGISQNLTLISALMSGSQGNYEKVLSDFQAAASVNSIGTQEVREQLAQAAAQIAGSSISNDIKQKFLQVSVAEMTKQEKISPLDARFPLFTGLVYQAYGDLENARKSFDRALELSPTKQSIFYQVGQNAIARNDAQGALDAFRSAYEVEPENAEARLYYAALLIRAGSDQLADEVLAPIIPTGRAADQRIAAAYGARGQYHKIAKLWEAKVAAEPWNSEAYFTLAAAYYAAGDTVKSISTLRTAIQNVPSVTAEAEKYIQQVQDGTAPKP